VYVLPMTFTILSGRWVGNTGCPAKSSMKGGHPRCGPCRHLSVLYKCLISLHEGEDLFRMAQDRNHLQTLVNKVN
jgi:hypothetical protein